MKLRIQRYECGDRLWYKLEQRGWFGRWSSVYVDSHCGPAGVTFTSDVTYSTIEAAEFDLNRFIKGNEPVTSMTVKEVST